MQVLVTTLRSTTPEKLAQFLRAHSPVSSHCPACRTVWPCTLWAAGQAASRPKPTA